MTRPGIFVVILSLSAAVACASACNHGQSLPPIDLVAELSKAERRAAGAVDEAVRIDAIRSPYGMAPALFMHAPSRVIYTVRLPRRARVVAEIANVTSTPGPDRVTVRLGLSDGRRYEELLSVRLNRAPAGEVVWTPIDLDLAAYSGWQFSLFYRPSRRAWHLILNADATPGGTVAWAAPEITFGTRRPRRQE